MQDYGLVILKGCENLIEYFGYIYVECSFIELYKDQVLVDEVIQYLINYSFKLDGIYNTFYDKRELQYKEIFFFQRLVQLILDNISDYNIFGIRFINGSYIDAMERVKNSGFMVVTS